MTDRLTALMHDEAAHLDIPAPPASAVLAQGRRLRRRRHVTTGLAAAAVLAVVASGAVGAAQLGAGTRADDVGPAVDPGLGAVFSVGTTVYFEDGREHAQIDDKAIKSMYYTSAGILVRHGNNPWSDGGGPQRFSLVTPEGDVQPIDVVTEETVHSTDPNQPYLAYAETVDGTVEVVVHDLRTDREAARVPMPGDFRWGGWTAPPVSLGGDVVYVGTDGTAHAVNWRTGEVRETDAIPPGYPDVSAGRSLEEQRDGLTVRDVATGEVLLEVPVDTTSVFGDLSLDGRFLRVVSYMGSEQPPVDVYAVEAGTKVTFDVDADLTGWTAEGDLMGVSEDGVVACGATTGDCETTPLDLAPGSGPLQETLKLGGATYES
jgi:hypothetical protein